jgi:hypothetical protein
MTYLVQYEMRGSIEIEADNEDEALAEFYDLPELDLIAGVFDCSATGTSTLDE